MLGGLSRVPSQKGISVLPVVLALKRHPQARNLVPPHLWKYFDEHLVVSGWYPERDYWVLIEALVKTMDPAAFGGDVWRYFARFSAQQDIAGNKANGKTGSGKKGSGVYKSFAQGDAADPASFFRRATRLWSQYHDSGRMEVVAGSAEANSVFMRLSGFVIPLEGFVRLQGYYLEEYGRLVGLKLKSVVTMSTARGDKFCEWEHYLARTPDAEAFVASLPVR
jgi:hypothetical protein